MLENQTPPTPVLIKDLGMQYPTETSKLKAHFALYKCSCGNEFKTQINSIKNGHAKSCGCYHIKRVIQTSITHGMTHHPLYKIWNSMIQRTITPREKNYFGRGITVCDRWKDVNNFIEDMYPSYEKGLSIDRINNDGNYEPSNCRWTTLEVQHRNTRKLMITNTSGCRGSCLVKQNNKWRAYIRVNRKTKIIGLFDTALEAGKAYDRYVIENNLEHTINGVL